MKFATSVLALFVAVTGISPICRADKYAISSTTSFVAGAPAATYEVDGSETAAITLTSTSTYTIKNISGSYRPTWLEWTIGNSLKNLTTGVWAIEGAVSRSKYFDLDAGETGTVNPDIYTISGTAAEGSYRANVVQSVDEGKTGETGAGAQDVRNVTVYPHG